MKTKLSIILIVVGLLASSCDNFLDVNKDPNNPLDVTPDLVLPVGLSYTSTYVGQDRGLNHLGSMMMFSYGESYGFDWYPSEFKYSVTSSFYSQMFNDAYSRCLKQYKVLTDQSDEYGYYVAIGNIMEAYHYEILVDLYNDVPYSEALQRGQNSTPTYDKGQAIYDSLIVKLSNAINTIQTTDALDNHAEVGDDDGVFGGDMSQWAAFANSLKIRILAREMDVKDAAYINGELSEIQNSGYGYISDNVGINPGYIEGEANKQNPYWNQLGADDTGNQTNTYKATPATQFVVDFFQGTNDPRFGYIFESPASGPNGINQGQPKPDAEKDNLVPAAVSNLNLTEGEGVLRGATMATIIMTKAELEFNLAELAQKGGLNVTDPAAHYKAGVEQSFIYLISADSTEASKRAMADTYLNQNRQNINFMVSSNKMNAILTQKWLATFGINTEQAWFDYNRTGYPNAQPIGAGSAQAGPTGFPISNDDGQSHSDRPVRLLYPASEATRNGANVPANSSIDPFQDKIFWAN